MVHGAESAVIGRAYSTDGRQPDLVEVTSKVTTRESTQAMADDLFAVVLSGQVKIHIEQRFPLAQVQDAHRALEARQTTGCTILTL